MLNIASKNTGDTFSAPELNAIVTDVNLLTSPRIRLFLADHFIIGNQAVGDYGSLGWGHVNGSVGYESVNQAGRPGIMRRTTSTTVNQICSLFLGPAQNGTNVALKYLDYLTFVVKPLTNDADYTIRLGIAGNWGNTPPTDWIGFEKLSADTNWFCVTKNSGGTTRNDTGIPFDATNWREMRITRNPTNGAITFAHLVGNAWVDLFTQTTTLPVDTLGMTIGMHILITAGSVARTLLIDYFEGLLNRLNT